jgi:hypothetical protein
MRMRLREHTPAALGAALGILTVGWLGLTDWSWNDYDNEARPAFDALVHGHIVGFAQSVPSYGGSLVLRAPFVLLTKLWHGGELSIFRASAFPCLVASGILAVWLAGRLRAAGGPTLARALAVLLCAGNPITVLALESGHPEALLGSVLCVAAVVSAMRNWPIRAGLLLGLALANQEWAVLAIGPVLLALPEGRRRALITMASVAGAVLVPLALAGHFTGQLQGAAQTNNVIFSPWQVWWFLGPHLHHVLVNTPWATRLEPHWLGLFAHPMIAVIGVPLTLICVWRRRSGAPRPDHEALRLLILLFLLRCALDPWDNWYYPLPFLIALLVWESIRAPRPPMLSLLATVAVWALTRWAVPAHGFSADGQSVLFLVMTVPGLVAIAAGLYAPGLIGSRLTRRARLPAPILDPA